MAYGRRRSSRPRVEEAGEDDGTGLPASCGSAMRKRTARRSSHARWGGGGRPLGTSAVSCVLRVCSGGCGERARAVGRGQRGGGGGGGGRGGEAREAGEWARGYWASPGADRLEGEAASTKQEVETSGACAGDMASSS